ncbi:MAG: TlpA disulfide reductase family protein [Alphaproteobacteria bacterium]|nr:TlpA disulfide reductase family protein [Alphaproteobacteria bacterium]
MVRYKNNRLSVLALCLFILFMSSAHAAMEIGQPAPPLIVTTIEGKIFDLSAQRGKVAIVHFWATWCPECRVEMPALAGFYRTHHDRSIELVGISIERDRNKVADFMKDFGFPAAVQSEITTSGFDNPRFIPVTYIFDKNGILRARLTPQTGILTEGMLAKIVQPLLIK